MEKKQKSTATIPQALPKISLNEAIDVLGVSGLNRYSAQKIFKFEPDKTEKEWMILFKEKRILQK